MESRFSELNGRLVDIEDGAPRSRSIVEIWSIWRDEPDAIDPYEVTGLATPCLKVALNESEVQAHLSLKNERGEFVCQQQIERDWDHVVIEKFVIPIKTDLLQEIFACLDDAGTTLGSALSKKQFLHLVTASQKFDFSIDLVPGMEEALELKPINPNLEFLLGSPYPYQQIGIHWLVSNFENGLGSLLCDEMGLGKTYQALGLIAHAVQTGKTPILICCPASLVGNWLIELSKFTSLTQPLLYLGSARSLLMKQLSNAQLVLTTYDLLVRDAAILEKIEWSLIVADEAQAVKNHTSQRHIALNNLSATSKVLITGTPIENYLTDLWALTDIVHPGLLGDYQTFEDLVNESPSSASEVGEYASLLILRREVSEVATDLPPLVVIDGAISPSEKFSLAYEEIRVEALEQLKQNFLTVIIKLQQVCCYPGLIVSNYIDNEDAKFIRLAEILDELSEQGRDKVLIFSTFTKSIQLIKDFINDRYGADVAATITGSVPPSERQEIVESFNSAVGFRVLVINPKAGGVGLNITGANHVIHFNRQWNPAVERQATARAYRRKQEKTVFLHNFYYLDTIEEVVQERLTNKAILSDEALESALSDDDEIYRSMVMFKTPINQINREAGKK